MSKILELADKYLTPKEKKQAVVRAMRKILELEKQGSKKAKAALDKIRNSKDYKDDLVKEPTKNESRLIEIDDELDSALDEFAAIFEEQGKGTLNSGVDPEILQDGLILAGYHIENGARSFADYAKAVVDDMGDMVKPYLKSWYMGIKYDPRASNFEGMSSAAEVESADIDAIFLIDQEKTQDNTLKWWWPQTTEDYQAVLAVQTVESEMTPQLHNLLMESKLRRLVQEDENPRETMMMSVEHLPEIYMIGINSDVKHYAAAIMFSDSMSALMAKIIWPLETTEIQEEQQETIQESVEEQSLMSILEKM